MLLQFLSNELALGCDDFVVFFSPQFVQKWNIVIDFNCITADSEKTLHCRKVIRCLTFFFLLL